MNVPYLTELTQNRLQLEPGILTQGYKLEEYEIITSILMFFSVFFFKVSGLIRDQCSENKVLK